MEWFVIGGGWIFWIVVGVYALINIGILSDVSVRSRVAPYFYAFIGFVLILQIFGNLWEWEYRFLKYLWEHKIRYGISAGVFLIGAVTVMCWMWKSFSEDENEKRAANYANYVQGFLKLNQEFVKNGKLIDRKLQDRLDAELSGDDYQPVKFSHNKARCALWFIFWYWFLVESVLRFLKRCVMRIVDAFGGYFQKISNRDYAKAIEARNLSSYRMEEEVVVE